MRFYSTKNPAKKVSLKEAVFKGLPPDNGLYMPEYIPELSLNFFRTLPGLGLADIAIQVSRAFFKDDLSEKEIIQIATEAINFPAPVVRIEDNIYTQELFHGPTLAFKDFGARFMSRLLQKLHTKDEKVINILVATSGDTGSAVANGFYEIPGIRVIILYPSEKISRLQEQQISTLGKNVIALEVDGVFDDCQQLVKSAFLDKDLNDKMILSSANSINIARLLPQSFYYFHAYGQVLKQSNLPLVFCIPSGNLGNITAGLIAKRMGLPVIHFISALNSNSVFEEYLNSGEFHPRPSVATISNAMDVGNPSNLTRIIDLYNHKLENIKNDVSAFSFSDNLTRETITKVYEHTGYILDPHGAVGYLGVKEYFKKNPGKVSAVFMETAHPAKFSDVVEKAISKKILYPEQLKDAISKKKQSIKLKNNKDDFREFLLEIERKG